MFTGTCFRHAENTIYFFLTYRNTSSCMAYAITKAGVRWFLDSYPMPVPLNLMALAFQARFSMTISMIFMNNCGKHNLHVKRFDKMSVHTGIQ